MAITLAELTRRLDEVAQRFEALANRLDTTYFRKESFVSYRELADAEHQRLRDADKAIKAQITDLTRRIADLEDGRKWISRLVIGFIVTAVLAAFLVVKTGAHP